MVVNDVTGVITNMMAVTSSFYRQNNFFKIVHILIKNPQKGSPALSSIKKNFEVLRGIKLLACLGSQIISLPEVPTCLGPAL